eukprot:6200884-Pleurochrysis_carterae.AAC.6
MLITGGVVAGNPAATGGKIEFVVAAFVRLYCSHKRCMPAQRPCCSANPTAASPPVALARSCTNCGDQPATSFAASIASKSFPSSRKRATSSLSHLHSAHSLYAE